MKPHFVVLIAGSIASVIFILWRVDAAGHDPITYREAVYDPSLSFTGGCRALAGIADGLLLEPHASSGTTLSVSVLGDASSADEPRPIAEYPIPESRKVIEGRHAGEDLREKILGDIWTKCAALNSTSVSPIHLGVQQAIADLHAKGCEAGARCELWVATDLEENADGGIKQRINDSARAQSLPSLLDNGGITVTFCGFAQTAGRPGSQSGSRAIRGPQRDELLQSVWRSLFGRPESVKFEPYCPQSRIPTAFETNASSALSTEQR